MIQNKIYSISYQEGTKSYIFFTGQSLSNTNTEIVSILPDVDYYVTYGQFSYVIVAKKIGDNQENAFVWKRISNQNMTIQYDFPEELKNGK